MADIRQLLSTVQTDQQRIAENSDRLLQGQSVLQTAIKRQSSTLEDCADDVQGLAEHTEDLHELKDQFSQTENHLVALATLCMDQLSIIERTLLNDTYRQEYPTQAAAWAEQFAQLRKERDQSSSLLGLTEIHHQLEGTPFDHHSCEIIDVTPTRDKGQEGQVARVIEPGYVYCGKTLKKAHVTVYQYR